MKALVNGISDKKKTRRRERGWRGEVGVSSSDKGTTT